MTGERILLVEDGADVRHFLVESVLIPAGYDVLTATDGQEGFTLARDLRPDLVIADYLMPHWTGLEMLAALHEASVELPFILITAEGSEALAVQALRLGVSDYLIKPFDMEELLRAIQRVLREHWTRQITQHIPEQLLDANRQLEARLRELDTLVDIGRHVTSLLDLQSVLNEVVEKAVRLTGAEHGSLFMVDDESGDLYLYSSTHTPTGGTSSLRIPISDSLVGQVVQTGEPLVITGESLLKIKTHYLARDLIYLPLSLQNRVIGVLGVTNEQESRSFEPHTLQLLGVLAGFASVAIENARLYSATERNRSALDTLLRNTEDPVIVVDPRDRVLFCNPSACEAFGLQANHCQGYPLPEVIPHQEVLELFAKEARSGRRRTGEIALDDGKRVLNAQLTVIEQVGKVVVAQDITHLKELDRIKSEFVTTVSHDLRSPLTAILGYVELLSRSGPLNDTQKHFADRIIYSTQSITVLITDLLELGRIEAGFDHDREPTPLNQIIHYALEGQRHHWETTKQQQLEILVPDNVPPVLGHPHRLRQMVNNLLENAIKYTPEHGMITISLDTNDGFLVLRVTDTGIGIPVKDQPYIFDKFYRSDQAIENYTGTGLGLSIVKGIVEQHQGRIWVESQVDQGTTFTIMLPAYEG